MDITYRGYDTTVDMIPVHSENQNTTHNNHNALISESRMNRNGMDNAMGTYLGNVPVHNEIIKSHT